MLITTKRQLSRSLQRAGSYAEWREAAAAYDRAQRLDRWRRRDQSRQYDYVSIRTRLDQLRSLKARGDLRGVLYTLNEGIHGNMGGMGRAGLYSHARSGTKHLIEEYIAEIVDSLEMLDKDDSGDISAAEKLDFFRRASQSFGHTAFMMSGSGSLLFFHVGVVRALLEAELLPTVLSGASGGSIVGSVVCTHSDAELPGLLQPDYFFERLPAEVSTSRVVHVNELEEAVAGFIPDLTFQQALQRSGRAMNISVAPAETHQNSRLLNATTSPSVLVRSAVMASAAVPGIFPPVTLQALDSHGQRKAYLPSRRWVDGSVSDDLPAKRLARLYGVNHYIVSQTNPHVLPFVTDGTRRQTNLGLLKSAGRRSAREWFNATTLILERANRGRGRASQASALLRSVINQDYVGDINILPDYRLINPLRLFHFPDHNKISRLIAAGERCTWPRLEMIHQQTRISRSLRAILERYEGSPVI